MRDVTSVDLARGIGFRSEFGGGEITAEQDDNG
jgi:hypothetical protein